MAAVTSDVEICESIARGDVDAVTRWLRQNRSNVCQPVHGDRNALHLAVVISTPHVVQCLVAHGLPVGAALQNGRTALHLAAERGDFEIMRVLLSKTVKGQVHQSENRHAVATSERPGSESQVVPQRSLGSESSGLGSCSDFELVEAPRMDADSLAASASIEESQTKDGAASQEPDFCDIDSLATDIAYSPLHVAIVEGHEVLVRLLCEHGADATLPAADCPILALVLTLPCLRAASMATLLLQLGATSSQVDSTGLTAFQRFVDSGNHELIDLLLNHDKSGVQVSLNLIQYSPGATFEPDADSPLYSAVKQGDQELVIKLIEAGALPQIDFDTWLPSASRYPGLDPYLSRRDSAVKRFRKLVEQPLIIAIELGKMNVALSLLEHGADPQTLDKNSLRSLDEGDGEADFVGTSALDLVRDQIRILSKERDDHFSTTYSKPILPRGMDDYLQALQPRTYQHWMVARDQTREREQFLDGQKPYLKQVKEIESSSARKEKERTIQKAITELKLLEEALTARDGKEFVMQYPRFSGQKRPDYPFWTNRNLGMSDAEEREYEYSFEFRDKDAWSERRAAGYIQLMEAAWAGDLETVEELTMKPFGPKIDEPTLKINICDAAWNTPFSLAFLHGHLDVCRRMLEASQLRNPQEATSLGRTVQSTSPNADPSTPLDVIQEIASTFRAENGEVKEEFEMQSLFLHALDTGDQSKLEHLLDWIESFGTRPQRDAQMMLNESLEFLDTDFIKAVQRGKWHLLGLLIQRTGAGAPFQELLESSKVENQDSTSKNLQSLGPRGISPRLLAAFSGSLEAVQFFSSGRVNGLYLDYFTREASQRNLDAGESLSSAGQQAMERAIANWLDTDKELMMHFAVMGDATDESQRLLKHLIKTSPENIDARNPQGDTPLLLAYRLGRPAFAKALIDAKADQSARNNQGENLIHSLLCERPKAREIVYMLDLMGPKLRLDLFRQQTSGSKDNLTPLHAWLSQICEAVPDLIDFETCFVGSGCETGYRSPKGAVEVVKLLLSYSKGLELDLFNETGDTCLHTAIRHHDVSLVKALIDFQPEMLFWENAQGRTPLELAQLELQSKFVEEPSMVPHLRHGAFELKRLPDKMIEDFIGAVVAKNKSSEELRCMTASFGLRDVYAAQNIADLRFILGVDSDMASRGWAALNLCSIARDLCSTALVKHQGQRRLADPRVAKDAHRRFEAGQASSGGSRGHSRDDESDDSAGKFTDIMFDGRYIKTWGLSQLDKILLGILEGDENSADEST